MNESLLIVQAALGGVVIFLAMTRVTLQKENAKLHKALRDLVDRCDGTEGVQQDGSNMDTYSAHAALGDFHSEETES